jgi:hypothetical protein
MPISIPVPPPVSIPVSLAIPISPAVAIPVSVSLAVPIPVSVPVPISLSFVPRPTVLHPQLGFLRPALQIVVILQIQFNGCLLAEDLELPGLRDG